MEELNTDIVVVGYGFAGTVAAIVAHDMGTKVLIAEKMEHFGGCSMLSGGGIMYVKDPAGGFQYFKEMCGGRTPDAVIRAQGNMMATTVDFIDSLCRVNGAKYALRGRPGTYPFPGRDSVSSLTVREVPGFEGYPWLIPGPGMHGYKIMRVLEENITKRGIPFWLSSAVKELLVNGKGEVVGVLLDKGGTPIRVNARKGVILACGGFEHSSWLHLQYLEGKPYYSMAPLGNTGDGIAMAQQVGASLWHMWQVHGSYGFKYPEYRIAFRHHLSGARDPVRIPPLLLQDAVDRRGSARQALYERVSARPPGHRTSAARPV